MTGGSKQQSETIAKAIRHSLSQVRKYIDIYATDIARLPTKAENAERHAKVEEVCAEMDTVADKAVHKDVRFPEYDELRQKLADLGAYPLDEDVRAIAGAFMVAGQLDADCNKKA